MTHNNNASASPGHSVRTLLMLCFALTAILPITFLGIKIYNAAWDNAWREVKEKHQLLAENLGAPMKIYVNLHKSTLMIAAKLIRKDLDNQLSVKTAEGITTTTLEILQATIRQMEGLKAIYLFNKDKSLIHQVSNYEKSQNGVLSRIGQLDFLHNTYSRGDPVTSPILIHPVSKAPIIFVAVAIETPNINDKHIIIVAELDILPIETLRRGIRFGQEGHSAIVDANGVVIAHPNPAWMTEAKDLSHLDIIQNMMAGKTGVTEFYSPFKKQTMVAGYTSVPGLGWGIMVPQPKWEMEQQVKAILFKQFGWGLVGLVLALVLAHFLGRWITQPLFALARAGLQLSQQGFQKNLPTIRRSAPSEIHQLAKSFGHAIHVLTASRAEVDKLNHSLQERIHKATNELRNANTKLSVLARSDHLTKLANRRHFEQTLTSITTHSADTPHTICLMLIDIDHFKHINDSYGHAAGDMVLVQVAEVLDRNMREADMSARYAGDEFVAMIHAAINIGRQRAEQIRSDIAAKKFLFNQQEFQITVSIGLIECDLSLQQDSVDAILQKADNAMYQAKHAGRNKVAELNI